MMAFVSLSHKALLGTLVAGTPATEAIEAGTQKLQVCVAKTLRERSLRERNSSSSSSGLL